MSKEFRVCKQALLLIQPPPQPLHIFSSFSDGKGGVGVGTLRGTGNRNTMGFGGREMKMHSSIFQQWALRKVMPSLWASLLPSKMGTTMPAGESGSGKGTETPSRCCLRGRHLTNISFHFPPSWVCRLLRPASALQGPGSRAGVPHGWPPAKPLPLLAEAKWLSPLESYNHSHDYSDNWLHHLVDTE